jgi:transcriptional regulator with XRE-family HTH domain
MPETAFGERLRELREKVEMSQKTLADKAGLSIRQVSRMETGDQRPSWDTVLALADALGVDCNAFNVTGVTGATTAKPRSRGRPRAKK